MTQTIASDLTDLLERIRDCQLCRGFIPEPRPVLRADKQARLLVIGQAPGTKVHASGIPWDDASGRRLRQWMGVSDEEFYDESRIAIVPMGFCYPGKGKSGDLPPRPECAATWHGELLRRLPNIATTLLIGQYAHAHYLSKDFSTVTERVRHWARLAPSQFPLPHPSPRNIAWLQRNPWFERDAVPALQAAVRTTLASTKHSAHAP